MAEPLRLGWCCVVDRPCTEVTRGRKIFDWNNYAEQNSVISIPLYLETHSNRLRARLITLLADLGALEINGKSFSEHLEVTSGFSLWWMSLPVEKSLPKSPQLFDCLRLMALEELLETDRANGVEFVGGNKIVADAINAICDKLGIGFIWTCPPRSETVSPNNWIKRTYLCLPRPVQGLLLIIRYVASKWQLRAAVHQLRGVPYGDVTVFSYFIHLNKEACSQGVFSSRHWGDVTELLNRSGAGANWFHHYLESPEMPNKATGLSWLSKYNGRSRLQGRHHFIDSYLSVPIVLRVIKRFVWLNIVAWRMRTIPHAFVASEMPLWLWPILQFDIMDSINGRTAAQNLIWYELFDTAIGTLPKQRLGLYLYENQGWERAMIYAWKKHGHGELIAVAHSTIRYWDLRYFEDCRIFCQSQRLATPLPDKLAVNGAEAFRAMTDVDYPLNRLATVEAQRYLQLANIVIPKPHQESSQTQEAPSSLQVKKRLLVLGDLMKRSTHDMMNVLQSCSEKLDQQFAITVKAHPGCPISESDYPQLRYQSTQVPLFEISKKYDVVFAANATSASLDALLGGVKVVVHLAPGEINLSPVRAMKGVVFVSTPEELLKALCEAGGASPQECTLDYFWLDPLLPRWRALISQTTGSPDRAPT